MKKPLILTLVFSVITVFTISSAVFAAPPKNTALAQTLMSLKLIAGTNRGLELDKVFTRAQGTVIVIKLLGMEKKAQEQKLNSTFTDVNNHWAAKYITFAYNNGIVHGTGNKQFSPERQMTGKELIALILRGLGYKETSPETAKSTAVKIGLFSENEADELTQKKVFLRDDMIFVVYKALTATLEGSTKTLLQTLVESNVVPKDSALASDLYSEIPQQPQDAMDAIEDAIRKKLHKS